MDKEALENLFEKAFENAQLVPQETVPQDLQLILYGLYKQATSGNLKKMHAQNPQDLRNAFKLNAWMQVKHLTIEQAMQEYIAIINNLMKERNIK